MANKDDKKPEHPELQIEPSLLDKVRSIVERRDFAQNLLDKARATDVNVKATIRDKVIADYDARLQEVMAEFEPVCSQISSALTDIEKKETDIRTKLEELTDDLEEQRFRCQLGEFPKEELEPREKEKVEARDALEGKIKVIEATYEEAKKYLSQEAFAQATKSTPVPKEPIPVPKPQVPKSQPEEPTAPGAGAVAAPLPAEDSLPEAEAEPVPEPEKTTKMPMPEKPAEVEKAAKADTQEKKAEPPPPPEADEAEGPSIKLIASNGDTRLVPLTNDKTVVGRHQSSDIVLRVAGVSRRHAEITLNKKGEIRIEDVSSGGGFSVNGKRQKKARLKGGDVITIGPYSLEIVAS